MARVDTSDDLGEGQGSGPAANPGNAVATLDLDYLTEPDDSEKIKGSQCRAAGAATQAKAKGKLEEAAWYSSCNNCMDLSESRMLQTLHILECAKEQNYSIC